MKLLYKLLLSLVIAAILWACECVPEIAGPKQVTPSDYANVLFVHSMVGQNKMRIESSGYEVSSDFVYDEEEFRYFEIGAGTNNIRLTTGSGSTIFNGIAEFEKDHDYTMIMYGRGSQIRSLVMLDSVRDYTPDWAYLRYSHVSREIGEVKFEVKADLTAQLQNLNYRSKSDFKQLTPGSYNIYVYDAATDELLAATSKRRFAAGSLYTLVLRGLPGDGGRPLECLIIEHPAITKNPQT